MKLPWVVGDPCPVCRTLQPQDAPLMGLHIIRPVVCAICETVFIANWIDGTLKIQT